MCCVLEERGITTDRQTREIDICMHTTHVCKNSSFLHTNTVLCIGSVCIFVKTDTTFVVTDNTYFVLLFFFFLYVKRFFTLNSTAPLLHKRGTEREKIDSLSNLSVSLSVSFSLVFFSVYFYVTGLALPLFHFCVFLFLRP